MCIERMGRPAGRSESERWRCRCSAQPNLTRIEEGPRLAHDAQVLMANNIINEWQKVEVAEVTSGSDPERDDRVRKDLLEFTAGFCRFVAWAKVVSHTVPCPLHLGSTIPENEGTLL